ncbi:MAG: nitrile hydratase accessory protein [Pseudomonadales bacterium]
MSQAELNTRLAELLPDDIVDDEGPVFSEPWQAQAFAMAVELIQKKLISWPEWADAIGFEIAHASENGFEEDGSDYYQLWVRALEKLVVSKDLVSDKELGTVKTAWQEAYQTTPHGQAVSIDTIEAQT